MRLFFLVILAAITLVAGEIPYSPGAANQNAKFDYIIIGGDTAGLTIAARLAEGTSCRVAVIKAGGIYEVDGGTASEIPGKAFVGVNTDPNDIASKIDWGFVTASQTALGGRKLYYARSKTLECSSARNYMGQHRYHATLQISIVSLLNGSIAG